MTEQSCFAHSSHVTTSSSSSLSSSSSSTTSSTSPAAAAPESSTQKQRKKRKWDQPDQSLFSAASSVPGFLPGHLVGVMLPGSTPASAALLPYPLAASNTNVSQMVQTPVILNEAAAIVQKQTQLKIQDELVISREIVINDAETVVRYKLTKRQTQEDIQRSTGAVVITRGKYRPPNSVPDGERPLYLHISAGAHLKETAERIIAVDRAAALVEEMLRQGQNIPAIPSMNSAIGGVKVSQPLSTCVYLGFDADPSLNIAARIHGPNDQYINHIMNETGATVLLRGHGSGIHDSIPVEGNQPLHLFLSCNDLKGLEDARMLADNLLDTVSREYGYTRVSMGRAYSAVPHPHNLLDGVQSASNEPMTNLSLSSSLGSSVSISSSTAPATIPAFSYVPSTQSGSLLNAGQWQPNGNSHSQRPLTSGTSYTGYGGIYPQATPLQQVALALRRSNSVTSTTGSVTSTTGPPTSAAAVSEKPCNSSSDKKGMPQKRKFQELPAFSRETAESQQESETIDLDTSSSDIAAGHVSKRFADQPSTAMPLPPPINTSLTLPKKFSNQPSKAMPPPPPVNTSSTMPIAKHMLPPPPVTAPSLSPPSSRSGMVLPPTLKAWSSTSVHKGSGHITVSDKSKPQDVPDTLIKIMEYGEDDNEDDDDESDIRMKSRKNSKADAPKPFWAV